jgi:hypothetical protein
MQLLFPRRCSPPPDATTVEKLVDIFLNGIATNRNSEEKRHE